MLGVWGLVSGLVSLKLRIYEESGRKIWLGLVLNIILYSREYNFVGEGVSLKVLELESVWFVICYRKIILFLKGCWGTESKVN